MKKIILAFFIFSVFLLSGFVFDAKTYSPLIAGGEAATTIITKSQESSPSNYYLTENIDESLQSVDAFTGGTFDGKGYTVKIVTQEVTISDNGTDPPTISQENQRNDFNLFGTIENATIKNLKIQVITIITDNRTNKSIPPHELENFQTLIVQGEDNFGVLANVAINSDVENVTVEYGAIISENTGTAESPVYVDKAYDFFAKFNARGSFAFGGLIGRAIDGTVIKNCKVIETNNSEITICQTSSYNEQSIFVGAICGTVENSSIVNCLIDNVNVSIAVTENVESWNGDVRAGGIAGYIKGSASVVKNIVSDCLITSDISEQTTHIGAFFGYVESTDVLGRVLSNNVSRLASTSSLNQFGNIEIQYFATQISKYLINQQKSNYYSGTAYTNNDLWDIVYAWDMTIWQAEVGKLPKSQVYETFTLAADTTCQFISSNKDYKNKVLDIKFTVNGINMTESTINARYGDSVTVTASFVEQNKTDFSNFFNIVALKYNGVNLPVTDTGYEWDLGAINNSHAGTYSLELTKKTKRVLVYVDPKSTDDSYINGEVCNANATVNNWNRFYAYVDVEYGSRYTFKSRNVNELYDSNGWDLSTLSENNSTEISSSSFSFVVDENDDFTNNYILDSNEYKKCHYDTSGNYLFQEGEGEEAKYYKYTLGLDATKTREEITAFEEINTVIVQALFVNANCEITFNPQVSTASATEEEKSELFKTLTVTVGSNNLKFVNEGNEISTNASCKVGVSTSPNSKEITVKYDSNKYFIANETLNALSITLNQGAAITTTDHSNIKVKDFYNDTEKGEVTFTIILQNTTEAPEIEISNVAIGLSFGLIIKESDNTWLWYVIGIGGGIVLTAIISLIVVGAKKRGGGKSYRNFY